MKSCAVLSYYKQCKLTLPLFSPLLKVQEQTKNKPGALGSGKQFMHATWHVVCIFKQKKKAKHEVGWGERINTLHFTDAKCLWRPLLTGTASQQKTDQPNDLRTEGKHKTPIRQNFWSIQTPLVHLVILPKQRNKVFFQHSHKAILRQRKKRFTLLCKKGIRCARSHSKVQRQDVNCQQNYFILSNQLHLVSTRKVQQEKMPCNFAFAVQRKNMISRE